MMNAPERNWSTLFGDHTPEGVSWYGIWTSYALNQEVINSLKCVRNFRSNADQTIIYHTNSYEYADGSKEEKTWQIDKQICNQDDGILHPGLPTMRTLAITPEIYAVLVRNFEPGKRFGMELFFRNEEWRTSVVVMCGENSDIERFTQIREYLGSFPVKPPDPVVKDIDGQWIGEKQYINADLSVSNVESIENLTLASLEDSYQAVFLPDGIVINTPKSLQIGQEFSIIVGKFVSANKFKRLTAKYDKLGNFQRLTSEIFYRQ
ncbi:DUF3598 family protein [Tolypothrix sp. PCC 7910]|uniref:DUF3598 family protein n=1 Tax=Tolypothrix sp. PCC 7910 TaxID=2099387 RepID=UPI0014277E14|nr:DUF3598 family protein [Tolypothrix sp. PCC 7910]QIR37545.1 DUF3598 family protein [Tolypothrix sp. PCC 7910]